MLPRQAFISRLENRLQMNFLSVLGLQNISEAELAICFNFFPTPCLQQEMAEGSCCVVVFET